MVANGVVFHFTMASKRWKRTGRNTVHQVRTSIKVDHVKVKCWVATCFAWIRFENLVVLIFFCIFLSLLFPDSTVQPKFYCLLSPETSEDDISRLDSKVFIEYRFSIPFFPHNRVLQVIGGTMNLFFFYKLHLTVQCIKQNQTVR